MISKSQEEIAREKFELAAKEFDFVFYRRPQKSLCKRQSMTV